MFSFLLKKSYFYDLILKMDIKLTDTVKSNRSNTAIYISKIDISEKSIQDLKQLAEICSKSNVSLSLYGFKKLNNPIISEFLKENKIILIENGEFNNDIKNVLPICLPLKTEFGSIQNWITKASKALMDDEIAVANGVLDAKAGFLEKYLRYISNFWLKLFTGVNVNLAKTELTLLSIPMFEKIVSKNKIINPWEIAYLAEKNNAILPVDFPLKKNAFNFGDGFISLVKGSLLGFKSFYLGFFKVPSLTSNKDWKNINADIYKRGFGFLALLLLVLMLFTAKDYNVTWDEPAHNIFSTHVIKYYTSFGSDTSMFEEKNANFGISSYGSSVDLVIRAVNDAFRIKNEFLTRHIIDAIIGFFLVLFTALTVRRLSGWLPAILVVVALIGSPSLYGHFFNNSKDIPFAAGYIMSVYYLIKLLQEYPNVKHQTKVLLAIGIGFSLSVRVGAVLLFAFFAMFLGLYWLIIQNRKKVSLAKSATPFLKLFLLISVAAYFFGIFFWPYALRAPLTGVLTALKLFEKFGLLTYYELFEGVRLYNKPWYYIPKMIGITAPIGILVGFVFSIIFSWIKKDKINLLILFLLFFVTIFPLAYAIYKKSYVYNGWRHFLFIYPTIVVLAVLGWHSLASFFKNKIVYFVFIGIFIAFFLQPIKWSIVNHPYQYMYFNQLIGGTKGAHGNYDLDYWNQTPREAFEWLVKNNPEILEKDADGKPKFKINANSNQEALKTFVPQGKDVPCAWTREMEWTNNNWDYAIWSTRTLSKDQILGGYWPPKGTIHTINVDGVPITAIVKAEHQYSNKGNAYLKKNKSDSALFFYLKAYYNNPLEEEYARGVANSYKGKNSFDSAIMFYKKAIQLKIGNYDALQSLGEIYYTQALMKNQQNPDKNLLKLAYENLALAFKNKKNASAPLLMGEIDLLLNRNEAARSNFYSFLETYGNVGRGYLGLGKAQIKFNELDSALMNFQYAIQLEPNNAEAYFLMASESEKLGRKQEAQQYYNQYLKLTGQ